MESVGKREENEREGRRKERGEIRGERGNVINGPPLCFVDHVKTARRKMNRRLEIVGKREEKEREGRREGKREERLEERGYVINEHPLCPLVGGWRIRRCRSEGAIAS